ncbi:MAG: histidine kinase [Clostridiales bacterium]|nr:histidine kinase [Candidatus Blautia equi]
MSTISFQTLMAFLIECLFYGLLITTVVTDTYIAKKNKKVFLRAILFCVLNLLTDFLELWVDKNTNLMMVRVIASAVGYSVRPFILLCFLRLSFPKRKLHVHHALAVLNLLLYATAHFTHLATYFTEGVTFHRGPLGYTVYYICGLGLLDIMVNSTVEHLHSRTRRWIILPLGSMLIVNSVYSDYTYQFPDKLTALNKALILVLFLYYLFYHLQMAEQYEEKVLQNQQLQLMISQIKPHFFFNTLTTIQALCTIDPKKASKILGLFASYIRQNLSAQTTMLIPFSRELQHIKTYAEIEMLRFPNIEVQYDLNITDFDIAALSIQPLVENAIKHGIRSREHGLVTIRTRQNADAIILTIEDNGIGFDPSKIEDFDESHIGIRNVRSRLHMLQQADMDIQSNDNGTTITITLPWEN